MELVQYALVLVLVLLAVLVGWQAWCVFALKLANPVLDGLEAPTVSTRMCGQTSNFLDQVISGVKQIRPPKLQPVEIHITPSIVQFGIGLGLLLLTILLVMMIVSLLKNLSDELPEAGNGIVKTLRTLLEGAGVIKLIETLKGARPHRNIILFLAAGPIDQKHLRLDEELRELQENLQLGKLRESFILEVRTALRPKDLTRALLSLKPKIVHFSGHGTQAGELVLEDRNGQTLPVPPRVLSNIFKQFENQIQCVVLNACYSDIQAQAISSHIKHVIGADHAIADKAAIEFSIGFYQGLSEGASIEKSFELGRQLAALYDDQVTLKLRRLDHKVTSVLLH